jgi:hypothetical protein
LFSTCGPHSPGTEIKVESAVPIIPKATKYHLEFLFALKKSIIAAVFFTSEMRNSKQYSVDNNRDRMAKGVIFDFEKPKYNFKESFFRFNSSNGCFDFGKEPHFQ